MYDTGYCRECDNYQKKRTGNYCEHGKTYQQELRRQRNKRYRDKLKQKGRIKEGKS